MRTLFWLFDDYDAAQAAVTTLLDQPIRADTLNAMILEERAKEVMDLNWEKASVHATDEVGEQTLHGLSRLLAGQQPVEIQSVGEVYAAGALATLVAKTASGAGTVEGGLPAALIDLNVPRAKAQTFAQGIEEGDVLVWVRAPDALATAVAAALADQQGAIRSTYAT